MSVRENGGRSVKYLLGKGAKVNEKCDGGRTALMWASARGHLEIIEVLVENGADINESDKYDGTSLMFAKSNGYPSIAKYLIEKGAKDVDIKGKVIRSPFMIAIEK